MADLEVRGRLPTGEEAVWVAAAEALSPEKSLERVETLVKFVFANVAIAGTLMTGLGLFTDLKAALRDAPTPLALPVPILLIGVSLILSVVALIPRLRSIRLSDLNEVENWYRRQILRRGWSIVLALITFAIALGWTVALGFAFAQPKSTTPLISVRETHTSAETRLSAVIRIPGAPRASTAETTIRGYRGKTCTLLFHDISTGNGSEGITVRADLKDVGSYQGFLVRATLLSKDGPISGQTLALGSVASPCGPSPARAGT